MYISIHGDLLTFVPVICTVSDMWEIFGKCSMSEFLCYEHHVKVYFIIVFMNSNHNVYNEFFLVLKARGKNPPCHSLYRILRVIEHAASPAWLNPGTLQTKFKDQLSSLLLVKNFSDNIFSFFLSIVRALFCRLSLFYINFNWRWKRAHTFVERKEEVNSKFKNNKYEWARELYE